MKIMYKTIIFMAGILLAVEYYFAKMNWKTRRRYQRKARRLKNKVGNMFNKVYLQWK